ncbi:hypothetical protein EIK76_03755 [Rheinheimera mesophila]|uniref:Uncharacterized protein n=1 Tax=Rheinheimera mesophila TaxID=1547515 RepID=A0A3P3QPN3_9GAMM|nr:hypothetical protein [Rheinheimera mesophila]KKL01561.1 hypothetical protein SD53_09555 [Rheinheimera mesophila]RRJ23212.1 hypothetical protein EIK76_03755 [Rheinheimera mesophila]
MSTTEQLSVTIGAHNSETAVSLSEWLSLNEGKVKLGFRLLPSAVLSQMTDQFEQFSRYSHLSCIGLVNTNDVFSLKQQQLLRDLNLPLLYLSTEDFGSLSWLNIVFLQETNFADDETYPKDIIKIGSPHGTDISLKKTLVHYGGLMEFDYILCPVSYTPVFDDAYIGLVTSDLSCHSMPFCCAIPFGMPKYDRFFQACQEHPYPEAIIYHLSNLKIENPSVVSYIAPVLELLLRSFPDRSIIFRPFPEDQEHPFIQQLLKQFSDFPNFTYSCAPSYISDYVKGAVMLCHRDYSEHLFVQASKRPMLVFDPCSQSNTAQVRVESIEQLIPALSSLLAEKAQVTVNNNVFNSGSSVDYLVSQLHYILDNKRHPQWQYFELYNQYSADTHTVIQYHMAGVSPFHKTALRALKIFPDCPEFFLAALESLGRTPIYSNRQLSEMYWEQILHLISNKRTDDLEKSVLTGLEKWFFSLPADCRFYLTNKVAKYSSEESLFHYLLQLTEVDCTPVLSTSVPVFIAQRDLSKQLNDGPVLIYGAGELTKTLLTNLSFIERFDVLCIVDSNLKFHGRKILEYNIEPPEKLLTYNAPILICSRAYAEEIDYHLRRQLGIKNAVYVLH